MSVAFVSTGTFFHVKLFFKWSPLPLPRWFRCGRKKETEFLHAMANWLEYWHSGRIPNCQRFTLIIQNAAALIRTLRSHALLIDNLLDEGYEFVLTARFQVNTGK